VRLGPLEKLLRNSKKANCRGLEHLPLEGTLERAEDEAEAYGRFNKPKLWSD
jgi:hypothetical protein